MAKRPPVSTRRPVPDDMFDGRLKGSYLLDLEVIGVNEVAPHVRLITMASSDLVGFEYAPGQDLLFEFPMATGPSAVATPSGGQIQRKASPTSRSRSTMAAAPPPAGRPRQSWASTSRPSGLVVRSACDQRRRLISSSSMTPRCEPPSSCSKRSPRTRPPRSSSGRVMARTRAGADCRAGDVPRVAGSNRDAREAERPAPPRAAASSSVNAISSAQQRNSWSWAVSIATLDVQGLLATGPAQRQPRRAVVQLTLGPGCTRG